MSNYTHNLSNNFTEKVNKTQDIFYNSYQKKHQFIAVLDNLQNRENLQTLDINHTHFFEVFGSGKRYENFKKRLIDCGSYLTFRYYHKKDVTRLHNANFCKADKLCPACAVRRAYKQQQKFLKAWNKEKDLQSKNWYYIVIPVKHSIDETIEEVYNRLDRVRKSILQAIRDNRKGKGWGFWSKFDGGMGSIEVTKTRNGWNVHLNLLVCSDMEIELREKRTRDKNGNLKINYINDDLMDHLRKVGDGSFVHNIAKIDTASEESLKSNLVEVLKYSLKFSSLSTIDLVKVYMSLYRKRLFFTFGILWGMKLDNVELEGDDVVDDEFIEVIYERVAGGYKKVSEDKKKESKKSKDSFVKGVKSQVVLPVKRHNKPIEVVVLDRFGLVKSRFYDYSFVSDFAIFANTLRKVSPPPD